MEETVRDQMEALREAMFQEGFQGYDLKPEIGRSDTFKFRNAVVDERICKPCWEQYGAVYPAENAPDTASIRKGSHFFCRCFIDWLRSIQAGTVTIRGLSGADYTLKTTGRLPENYLHKEEARKKGWKPSKGNLWDILPGICIYEAHENRKRKLPDSPGREWYEADINYHGGYRNSQRILFSNDGLIFVSYDHYRTYFQIV